jgi:plasmid stabilization system protein ParE
MRELEETGNLTPLLNHRPDIQSGTVTYPLARKGKPSPHHFYPRIKEDIHNQSVIILRVLHQRMDPEVHLRPPQPADRELLTEAEELQATPESLSHNCSATVIRWMHISREQPYFRGRVKSESFNPR